MKNSFTLFSIFSAKLFHSDALEEAGVMVLRKTWTEQKLRVLSGLLLLGSTMGAAQAQYFNQPVPRYYPAPHYQPRPWPEMVYSHPAPVIVEQAPTAEFGSVCVTEVGQCGTFRAVPVGAGCSCRIPGYGKVPGSAR